MRVQKAKLLILVVALAAGTAVAGRLGWYAVIGKHTIRNPDPERMPEKAVTHWWEKYRKPIWEEKGSDAPTARTKLEAYSTISTANVSGAEPPKREEVREATPVASGPEPYPHFAEVSISFLVFGDADHRQDDRVVLTFEPKQPRPHLGEEGRKVFDVYRAGETLAPFPEIKVEALDPAKNYVAFRMPKHRDARGRYESYKGDASDSQLVERTVESPSLDSNLLSQQDKDSLDSAERADGARRAAAIMRLQALDREAPQQTEETYPGSNVWALGTEDLLSLEKDYDERLRQDVTVASYNKNGVVGVQIQRIEENSVFFSRGLMQNDVVTAVNGQGIATMSEAVRYVRKNPDRNVYEVTILRNGRERVLSYHVPR